MDDQVLADFAKMGVTLEEDAAPREASAFEVWPENWDAVVGFLNCQTQWRAVAGHSGGQWLGLDYAGVDVVLRRLDLRDANFADIQEMEYAALEAFQEHSG